MSRALGLLLVYVAAGTLFTILGYRLVLGGPITAGADRTLDGLVIFVSIAFNTALAFAAAGVVAAVLAQARSPWFALAVTSMVVAGVIGLMLTLWFTGLNILFPIVMALGGLLSAGAARLFGLLPPRGADGSA